MVLTKAVPRPNDPHDLAADLPVSQRDRLSDLLQISLQLQGRACGAPAVRPAAGPAARDREATRGSVLT